MAEDLARRLGWFSIGLGAAELLAPSAVAKVVGVRAGMGTRILLRLYGIREIAAGIGILSQPREAGWLWARVAGDSVDLATLGAAFTGSKNNRLLLGVATAAVAGVTAADVYAAQELTRETGWGGSTRDGQVRVTKTMVINKSPEEVYQFWRKFENLPTFMRHLANVRETGEGRTQWTAKAPAGTHVSWEAEITDDQPNSHISWRSVEGSTIENRGTVRFERATGDRGTVVRVDLQYSPPGGAISAVIARLFGEEPKRQLEEDLRAFKQIIETGEVIQSDASIHRGMHAAQPPRAVKQSTSTPRIPVSA